MCLKFVVFRINSCTDIITTEKQGFNEKPHDQTRNEINWE